MSELGPCVICGDTGYNLSCGGPTICPKCDCGHFDAATVWKQAKVIAALREELERSRGLLTLALHTEGRSVSAQCAPKSLTLTDITIHNTEVARAVAAQLKQVPDEDQEYAKTMRSVAQLLRADSALRYYADTYCEGWCKDAAANSNFDDCGGCRARLALALPSTPGQATEKTDGGAS